jgi:hypothetical protein
MINTQEKTKELDQIVKSNDKARNDSAERKQEGGGSKLDLNVPATFKPVAI